jgi:hypothetical protein
MLEKRRKEEKGIYTCGDGATGDAKLRLLKMSMLLLLSVAGVSNLEI